MNRGRKTNSHIHFSVVAQPNIENNQMNTSNTHKSFDASCNNGNEAMESMDTARALTI